MRGYRCGCQGRLECILCTKCPEHHHRNCTEEGRQRAEEIEREAVLNVAALRTALKINIFEREGPLACRAGRRRLKPLGF